jgi:hypothetical protein
MAPGVYGYLILGHYISYVLNRNVRQIATCPNSRALRVIIRCYKFARYIISTQFQMIRDKLWDPTRPQPDRRFTARVTAGPGNPTRPRASDWKPAAVSASLWQAKELNIRLQNTRAVNSGLKGEQQK